MPARPAKLWASRASSDQSSRSSAAPIFAAVSPACTAKRSAITVRRASISAIEKRPYLFSQLHRVEGFREHAARAELAQPRNLMRLRPRGDEYDRDRRGHDISSVAFEHHRHVEYAHPHIKTEQYGLQSSGCHPSLAASNTGPNRQGRDKAGGKFT